MHYFDYDSFEDYSQYYQKNTEVGQNNTEDYWDNWGTQFPDTYFKKKTKNAFFSLFFMLFK